MVTDSLCTSRRRKIVEGVTSDRTTVRDDSDMGWSIVMRQHAGSSPVALVPAGSTLELTHAKPGGQPSHIF
jgi:hypothetical protein